LDPRSDVYAIGVVLYEMLSGQVPLDADSAIQVVVKQLHETPRPVRELSAEIPEGIAQVVMRALEKDPERRPPSAAELSAELQAAVEAEGGRLPATGSGPLYDPLASRTPTGTRVGPATPSQWPPSPPSSGSGAVTTPPEGAATPPSFETTAGARLLARLGQLPAAIKALAAVMLIAVVGITAYWSFSTSSPGKAGAGDQGTPRPDPPAPEGMVFIPGGKFKMGRDSGGEENESPAREVEVQPFFIDQLEVTNQEYKKFVDATGHPAPQHWKNGSYVPDEATLPVTYVTWEDATAYARWAEKRLPTEAEWEYTARGGAQRLYPWGDQWQDGYANVNRKDRNKPAPVRGFETDRSPFGDGIYGLAGNVSEWVQDSYIPKYGGPADERLRVYRGGNFFDVPRSSTFRYADFPRLPEEATQRREYERYVFPFVGFRCAKDVVP
jgi:formylglycine-generating enzyme required for sulfatase activity